MKYHDGRFARHPRFRYVVFNTIMRRQASAKAGFNVKQKTVQGRDVTADDLRAAFEDDSPESEALLNSITRRPGTLRGTRPFWAGRRRQLEAMVKNIGPGHLFITFSAADLHWDDLMRHLPNYQEWKQGTAAERIRYSRENLRNNPHIVAQWFHIRYLAFKKEVLTKKFNIVDDWNRYEWQGRGSTHNHGVYWISGAPESEIMHIQNDLRDAFAEFWGILISAVNP
jgi:hypothetical protein